jgi:hypothetical protein
MFESTLIRVIVAVIVVVLGIMLLKILKTEKKSVSSLYLAPKGKMTRAEKKSALKTQQQQNTQVRKNVTWAPSAVDGIMSPNGAWDTNRNPPSFVTNVSKNFPDNGEMLSKDQLAWKSASMIAPTIPDVSMVSEFGSMPLPPNGNEDPFLPELGSAFE